MHPLSLPTWGHLLVAQTFRCGDDFWGIKELILIIFITHVPFTSTALIYKEKSCACSCQLFPPMPGSASMHSATNGRKPEKQREDWRAQCHST